MLELNRIYNMDCIEGMKLIDDNSIDLIVTDPPYEFENQGGGFYAKNKSTQRKYLDSLKKIDCCNFNPEIFLNKLLPKMKKIYGYFFCNKSLIDKYIKFAKKNSCYFDVLILAKSNPIPAYHNHHLSDLEYIIMIRDKDTFFSNHKNINDFRKFFIINCKKSFHPAEKPIDLIKRFIKVSSKQNNIVLDPFIGGGTTALACKQSNRRFIGFEINAEYVEIANKRLENIPDRLENWIENSSNRSKSVKEKLKELKK